MAILDDKQNPGMPPPPAPPRRSANPWQFSQTARKPDPRPAPVTTDLLAEIMKRASAEEAHREAVEPPKAAPARARPGLMPLILIGFAVLLGLRFLFKVREGGSWAGFIGPLIAIALILHGLWRVRQRREEKKSKPQ